jgi:hypothetical protein
LRRQPARPGINPVRAAVMTAVLALSAMLPAHAEITGKCGDGPAEREPLPGHASA